jgi:hypothetical protein
VFSLKTSKLTHFQKPTQNNLKPEKKKQPIPPTTTVSFREQRQLQTRRKANPKQVFLCSIFETSFFVLAPINPRGFVWGKAGSRGIDN